MDLVLKRERGAETLALRKVVAIASHFINSDLNATSFPPPFPPLMDLSTRFAPSFFPPLVSQSRESRSPAEADDFLDMSMVLI